VRLFLLGLFIGLGLPSIYILLDILTTQWYDWSELAFVQNFVVLGLRVLTLTIPITTGYSLIVDEIMDLSIVFAKTLRYIFGIWLIGIGTVVSFLTLLLFLYAIRDESLATIVSDPTAIFFAMFISLGFLAMLSRKRWLEALDKKFSRSPTATANLLNSLIESIPASKNFDVLCLTTVWQLENAFFPESINLYVLDPGFNRYRNIADSEDFILPDNPLVLASLSQQQAMRY